MKKNNQMKNPVFTCGAASVDMGWHLHIDTPIDKAIAVVKAVFAKSAR